MIAGYAVILFVLIVCFSPDFYPSVVNIAPIVFGSIVLQPFHIPLAMLAIGIGCWNIALVVYVRNRRSHRSEQQKPGDRRVATVLIISFSTLVAVLCLPFGGMAAASGRILIQQPPRLQLQATKFTWDQALSDGDAEWLITQSEVGIEIRTTGTLYADGSIVSTDSLHRRAEPPAGVNC